MKLNYKKVTTILFSVIIIIGILFFLRQREVAQLVNTPIMGMDYNGKNCDEYGSGLGFPEDSLYAQEVKKRLISYSNISESYFNTHLKFVCGFKYKMSSGLTGVIIYNYLINDYSIKIPIYFTSMEGNSWLKDTSIGHPFYKLDDKIIPKEIAIRKMYSCVGRSISEAEIETRSDLPLTVLRTTIGGMVYSINLETGKCNKYPANINE